MRLKDQTEEAFSAPNRKSAYLKARAETPEQKGLSYTDLLVDNIIGLDNDYESFGEAFGKAFNEDEIGTLKNMAVSAYEGAKEFVTSPIETTKDVATEISDSVSRLGAESLDGRIKRMYGVGYQEATDEQVTKAREAVIGDAITASSLVPAAKGATTVAKAAIPGKIQADVVGQMRSLLDGDKEFRTESKKPAQGLSAQAVESATNEGQDNLRGVTAKPSTFSARKNRTDLPPVEKYLPKKGEVTPDFQSALSSVKKDYAEQLEAAKKRGGGASQMFYARSLSLLENADENLVRDIADAAYSEDPRDSARRLLYKYDESVIPDDVTISDLQELGIRLGQSFSGKLGPKEAPSTQFRSATEEATQAMEVGKKGLLGARFLKQLKKNPDVRDTEWTALNLEIDPNKLYSKEELVDIVGNKTYDVSVKNTKEFGVFQRQKALGLGGDEKDYFELVIEAKAKDGTTFKPKDNHYSEDTIAHTRASVKGPLEGVSDKDFILAEEFQSDLLQKGFLPAGKGSTASIDENLTKVDTEFGTQLTQAIEDGYQDFVWDDDTAELKIVEITPENNPQVQLLQRWNELDEGEKRNIVSLATLPEGADRYQQTRQAVQKAFNKTTSDTYNIDRVIETILRSAKPSEVAVRKPPIEKIGESVSLAIDSLLAEGQRRGITTLVIPPFEKIVEARHPKGSKLYLDAVSKKSGFYQTYITAVDKKLKELKAIGGVNVEKIDMTYPKSYEGSVTDVLVNLSDEDLDRVFTRIYGDEYTSGDLGSRDRLFQNELQEFAINSDLEDYYSQTLRETNLLPAVVDQKLKGTKIEFSGLAGDRDLTRPRFAQGGMVEDEQMNRLMQEGGMADDGMNREPVTGNEIPPGSLASEVRDDIPAQLSEGEYVVPADVLRYYGVRFFEDLRAQAKQGMMEMESDGRIGGTPVNAQGVPMESQDEELTPEEEQMLVEALGGSGAAPVGGARTAPVRMAYGGMVEQPAPTPYQDQATMYQMPEGMGGPMGMQEGGLTRDSTSTFDRTQFTIPESSDAFEARKYINPTTGEEKTVQFLNGLPMGFVPEGFVPWTPALAEQSQSGTQAPRIQTPSVKPVEVERGGRDMDQTPTTGEGSVGMNYQGWAEKNSDAIKSDPFAFGMNALKGAENTMGFFGKTPIGGLISDVNKLSALSNAQFALSQPMSKEQKNTLEAAIKSMENSLSTPVATIAVKTDLAAQGTQKKNAWEAYTSKATDTAPSTGLAGKPSDATASTAGAGRNIPGDTDPSGGVTRSGGRDQQGTSGTPVGTSKDKAAVGNLAADKALADKAAAQTDKEKADKEAVSRAQGDITRRAEGGLISKPQKTVRSRKGLAS